MLSSTFTQKKFETGVLKQDLKQEYHEILRDYIKKGIIKKIDDERILGKTYYLPYRAVVRHDIVFHGSAKVDQCTS